MRKCHRLDESPFMIALTFGVTDGDLADVTVARRTQTQHEHVWALSLVF